jgi:hypothetical protein
MDRLLKFFSLGVSAACLAAGCDASDIEGLEPVAEASAAIRSQGQLDRTFNGSGRLYADHLVMDRVVAVADAGGGKVAFFGNNVDFHDASIVRLRADGSKDTTWSWNPLNPGGDRVLKGDLDADSASAGDLVVVDGKTYAVGTMKKDGAESGYLVVLDKAGQLVPTFSGDGIRKMTPTPTGYHDIEMTQVGYDERLEQIVVGGIAWKDGSPTTGRPYLLLGRLDKKTGEPDNTFGGNGWVAKELPAGHHKLVGMALRPHSSSLTVGISGVNKVMQFGDLGRYDADFGQRTVPGLTDVAMDFNGCAYASTSGGKLYGFFGDGTPLVGFGAQGLDVGSYDGERMESVVYSMELGRIYVAGSAPMDDGGYIGTVVAVDPAGHFDRTFADGHSKVTTNFLNSKSDRARDIVVTGRKLLVGFDVEHKVAGATVGLARYNVDTGALGEPCWDNQCDGDLACGGFEFGGEYARSCWQHNTPHPPSPPSPPSPPHQPPPPPPPDEGGEAGDACFMHTDCNSPMKCLAGRCGMEVPGPCNNVGEACCDACAGSAGGCNVQTRFYCTDGATCPSALAGGTCQP